MAAANLATGEPLPRDAAAGPPPGFVLDEVELSAFMRYLDRQSLRLERQFTVITGRTGAGKTSLLDAVTFALYGRTTRTDANVTMEEILQPGGHVRLAFRQHGRAYAVKRGRDGKGKSYLEVWEGEHKLQGHIRELELAILNVVGLDYEGFRNSTFVRQEEMRSLGAARGADRLAIFSKLFRLEAFERAQEVAKGRYQAADAAVKAKEQEIATRKELLDRLPEIRESLALSERTLEIVRADLQRLEAAVREGEARVAALEGEHTAYHARKAAVEDLTRRRQVAVGKVAQLKAQVAKSSEVRAKIAALEEETRGLEALAEESEQLSDLQGQAALVQKELDNVDRQRRALLEQHERQVRTLSQHVFTFEEKIAAIHGTIPAEEAFQVLRDEGRLEERLDRIARELRWLEDRPHLVTSLTAEGHEARDHLERTRTRARAVNKDSFVLSELREQLARYKADLKRETEGHLAKASELDGEVAAAVARLQALGFGDAGRARLQEIRQALPILRGKREELDRLRRALQAEGDLSRLLAEAEQGQAELEKEWTAGLADLQVLEGREKEYGEARRRLEVDRVELASKGREVGKIEGDVRRLRLQVEQYEADAGKLEASQRELDGLLARRGILAVLKDDVFHRKGLVAYAIHSLLPALAREASLILAELTEGRFDSLRLEAYEEGKGYGIRIQVCGVDREWHDVSEFSGGERTQINAALRFAIAKELASMPQVGRTYGRMRTLFIDEGDLASLDAEGSRELFVQKLFSLGRFFERVVLITHLAEVAERFEGRVRVEMGADGRSRLIA